MKHVRIILLLVSVAGLILPARWDKQPSGVQRAYKSRLWGECRIMQTIFTVSAWHKGLSNASYDAAYAVPFLPPHSMWIPVWPVW
jgi:hypothetical protein